MWKSLILEWVSRKCSWNIKEIKENGREVFPLKNYEPLEYNEITNTQKW